MPENETDQVQAMDRKKADADALLDLLVNEDHQVRMDAAREIARQEQQSRSGDK